MSIYGSTATRFFGVFGCARFQCCSRSDNFFSLNALEVWIPELILYYFTSGHLDMGIGEDRLECLITQNLAFRWTWSVDSVMVSGYWKWFRLLVLICDAEKHQN
ncbi:hypothetical protein RclHR1_14430005 [Rhizophagus clarus]|uniref:Uncharacterized protein n=1 Tax=Rhizophagus clarus TaxID=94130 RepID=A0A2Z6QCK7_9GLOM|nr:hypothetical protein RclHR1_14430005 [Rhizophagus clarus]